MKKLPFLLIFTLLFTLLAPVAYATQAETTAPTVSDLPGGTCGDNLTWTYDNGTLTVSGIGEMAPGSPWSAYQDSITALVLTGGVTTVAENAFQGYTALKTIDFGAFLTEIGPSAFQGCTGLTEIQLPSTFRKFGESAFQDCSRLMKVHCAGGMPSFRFNCLWNGSNITVYYPTERPWGLEYVRELELNFGGRLEVLASDGTDPLPYGPEPTEAPTEEPTEAPTTLPETTEAPTVPQTTEAPTVPEITEVPTQPETEPETTETEPLLSFTQPPAENKDDGGSLNALVIILVGAAGLLAGIAAVVLVLKLLGSRGGKYLD